MIIPLKLYWYFNWSTQLSYQAQKQLSGQIWNGKDMLTYFVRSGLGDQYVFLYNWKHQGHLWICPNQANANDQRQPETRQTLYYVAEVQYKHKLIVGGTRKKNPEILIWNIKSYFCKFI